MLEVAGLVAEEAEVQLDVVADGLATMTISVWMSQAANTAALSSSKLRKICSFMGKFNVLYQSEFVSCRGKKCLKEKLLQSDVK